MRRITAALGIVWAVLMAVFAYTTSYALTVVALFLAGFLNLAFTALAQTLVQLEAPPERRGRVVGLFSMAQNGLRVGSGVTIGILGTAVGIHSSLGWSAIVTLAVCASLFALVTRTRTRAAGA